MDPWEVQIKGKRGSGDFEIAVTRKSNTKGRKSWGWFDDKKLLITHDGNCATPLTEKVWDKMVALAESVAAELNAEETGELE